MSSIQKIFYFPVNAKGEEFGESIPVEIQADGSADVSKLPEELRGTLEKLGTPDALHQGAVFPKDGEQFLNALLRNTNGYMRFRSHADKA